MYRRMRGAVSAVIAATLLVVGVSGCQGSEPETISISDAWVKAVDGGMSGMFAEITNPTSSDVVLVGARSDVAGMVEIHEVANGIMREKDGGVVITAGSTVALMPGADHVMLMGLRGPLLAGDTISVTLVFDSGQEITSDVMVKDFGGANEDYEPHGHSHDDDHGHGHDDDHGHQKDDS